MGWMREREGKGGWQENVMKIVGEDDQGEK